MDTPKLSYVIASRYDNFCGDAPGRLLKTIRNIIAMDRESEIVVVDWGSTGLKNFLFENIGYTDQIHNVGIGSWTTCIYDTPFCEVVALNAGIRRARGEWIARLDQDILIGQRFVDWFAHIDIDAVNDAAYFSLRRDLPENVFTCDATAPIWRGLPADFPGYFAGAVGILLARRKLWEASRGYDESLIHRNHMEHDLCCRFYRMAGLINLGQMIDCPFFHQWHERIEADSRPSNDALNTDGLILAAHHDYLNGPDWGLGDVELDEVVI